MSAIHLVYDDDNPSLPHPHLDGREVHLAWITPFISLLLCISFCPLAFPHFWHHYLGLVALLHALILLVPMFFVFDAEDVGAEFVEAMLHEYIPFIALIFSLFVTSGGIRLTSKIKFDGSPLHNFFLLFVGTAIASWVGTTGASLLLIRPLIRSNRWRQWKMHIFIYFIFLVANIGGSLSPLGDPPLFLGYLAGIDFEWFTLNMFYPMSVLVVQLLFCFAIADCYFYYRKEDLSAREKSVGGPDAKSFLEDGTDADPLANTRFGYVDGWRNVPLLIAVPLTILFTGMWEHDGPNAFTLLGIYQTVEDIVRDVIMYSLGIISILITPKMTRVKNGFSWFPIMEVGQLFFAIFVTIIPAVAILRVGTEGDLGALIELLTDSDGNPINLAYFWLTGSLSAFLDNAPTFLIFFNIAGGNPEELMGPLSQTLLAISCGAVFMGAMSYIGNAPNFMVKSIVEDQGIPMPSFMAYVGWALILLGPPLAITSLIVWL